MCENKELFKRKRVEVQGKKKRKNYYREEYDAVLSLKETLKSF